MTAAILFDLDGTLIDSEHLWWEAEVATMAALDAAWNRADQEHCLGGPLERVAAYMVARSGTEQSPQVVGEQLLDAMEELLRTRPMEWRPGARELLGAARAAGIPVGLVSASYRRLLDAVADAVRRDIGAVDGEHAFDVTVAGDEVPEGKPHPGPYLAAAERLGVPIGECIVIEDSPTGVASGQASGAFVVAVPHIVAVPEAPRRHVIPSLQGVTLADLAAWLADAPASDPASSPG